MDPFRAAGTLALVAVALLPTIQSDPTTAMWRVRVTNHFEIYYTPTLDVDTIAREAERTYDTVSHDLRREVSAKIPLILLPTSRDLPRTEREAAAIVRATGAPDRDHLLLAVEPRSDRGRELTHGLKHILEFDQRSRRP